MTITISAVALFLCGGLGIFGRVTDIEMSECEQKLINCCTRNSKDYYIDKLKVKSYYNNEHNLNGKRK